jgi:hypothetical protein
VISTSRLARIVQRVEQHGITGQLLSQLRNTYPDLHFTYCMDADVINVPPVEMREAFNVYLVDAHEHCLRLTTDHGIATGVVLAEVLNKEEY